MLQAPEIKPIAVPYLALPVTKVMPNGVHVHCLPGGENEVVRIEILFKGGYAVQNKPLQAMFTNRMLREGSESHDAVEISRVLDFYGAWIDMYSSQEYNHIILHVLAKYFNSLLPVVEDFVKRPLFLQKSLDVLKSSNKSHFLINSRNVEVVAQRLFEHKLWGEHHALGHIVEAVDYDNIERADLVEYHEAIYSSCNCTIFLSGCCEGAVLDCVESCFGKDVWGGNLSFEVNIEPHSSVLGKERCVMSGALQSAVKVGCMSLPASHPDIYALRFLNVLFGGYFGGRLMSNIRETHGYTYDIISEIDAYGRGTAFVISSQADNEYVEPLLNELYNELNRLRDEEIPVEEVELVRNYILGELSREYESLSVKSEAFVNSWLSGVGFETINDYLDVVKNITPARLQEVARKHLVPQNMFEIVVGG